MADELPPIKPGVTYWVQIDGTRLKLEVIEKSASIPSWWICRAPLGTEIVVPESAIREVVDPDELRRRGG